MSFLVYAFYCVAQARPYHGRGDVSGLWLAPGEGGLSEKGVWALRSSEEGHLLDQEASGLCSACMPEVPLSRAKMKRDLFILSPDPDLLSTNTHLGCTGDEVF